MERFNCVGAEAAVKDPCLRMRIPAYLDYRSTSTIRLGVAAVWLGSGLHMHWPTWTSVLPTMSSSRGASMTSRGRDCRKLRVLAAWSTCQRRATGGSRLATYGHRATIVSLLPVTCTNLGRQVSNLVKLQLGNAVGRISTLWRS